MEKRLIFFFILSFAVILVTNYFFGPKVPPRKAPTGQEAVQQPGTLGPAATQAPSAQPTPARAEAVSAAGPAPVKLAAAPKVALSTDVYNLMFTTRGGVPIQWDITDPRFVVAPPGQPKDAAKKGVKKITPEPLIDPDLANYDQLPRPFEMVLREMNASFYNDLNTMLYTPEKVSEGTRRGFRFTSQLTSTRLRAIKTYLFGANSFTGKFAVELVNEGTSNLTFDNDGAGLGLVLGPGLGKRDPTTSRYAMVDPLVKLADRIEYRKLSKPDQVETLPGGEWGGIQSLYFMGVLVPSPNEPFTLGKAFINPNVPRTIADDKTQGFYPTLELYGKPFTLKPGEHKTFTYEFFFGPKQRTILKQADHEFTSVLFFDSWPWMRGLCLGLMAMLNWLYRLFHNWGIAIIVLTLIVRLVTFPLVQKSMKSQAKMMAEQSRLKPLLDKINEKFKDDPTRKQQETFKLYKEHGVNPFGMFKGCAWMLIQFPIFIALYKLLYQVIDLRGAPFLWIVDLSQPDRFLVFSQSLPILGIKDFNLLPIIMAGTQVLASKYATPASAASSDAQQQQMQKTMTYFMPIFMLFIFYGMPSGLVLYWLISNIWQVAQQLYVNKHIKKPQAPMTAVASPKKA